MTFDLIILLFMVNKNSLSDNCQYDERGYTDEKVFGHHSTGLWLGGRCPIADRFCDDCPVRDVVFLAVLIN